MSRVVVLEGMMRKKRKKRKKTKRERLILLRKNRNRHEMRKKSKQKNQPQYSPLMDEYTPNLLAMFGLLTKKGRGVPSKKGG